MAKDGYTKLYGRPPTLEEKLLLNNHLYGKFGQGPEMSNLKIVKEGEQPTMDIFDKINGFMDDIGIRGNESESEKSDTAAKMEMALKAAKFLAVISDPVEREKAIAEGLKQAYVEGLKNGKAS